ncbi:MAG: PQQ-dependent sugar dehydrogenase [Thermomicrobiales bacterium]
MRRRRQPESPIARIGGVFLMFLISLEGFGGQALAQDTTPAVTFTPTVFDPATFKVGLNKVATGFDQPLFVTNAGDGSGRLFVVDKPGTIEIIAKGVQAASPFLDISDRVGSDGSEQGLLGLAFAPDYAQSGLFYVFYTDRDGNTVVSRFRVTSDPSVADPTSEQVVLQQNQPYPNHNGGDLVFGPDGLLYIGLGDGGSQGDPNGNGQNLDTWLGKILRIDVDPARTPNGATYAVPNTNPFIDRKDAKPEIFAYGLRNPWRFSFDQLTGDLYIGDVGQNTIEEIDFVPANDLAGHNFGWNTMEGSSCYNADSCDQNGLTVPVAEYTHDVGGCSVTGGYVYRGSDVPSLQGTYLFADYCSGKLWGLGRDATGAWVMSDPIETRVGASSFGQGEDGELYLIDINSGTVYQIVTQK